MAREPRASGRTQGRSPRRSVGRAWTWLALALALAILVPRGVEASSPAPEHATPRSGVPNWIADPPLAIARPGAAEFEVRVHNRDATPLALEAVRIRGSDWGSFTILDEENPETIPPGQAVALHIRADVASFTLHDEDGHASGHRGGRAKLEFVSTDGAKLEVPLRFDNGPGATSGWSAWLRMLTLIALCFVLARRTRWSASVPAASRPVVGLGLSLVLGTMLWSHPLCTESWQLSVGPLGRAQCATGLGGAATQLLTSPADLLALWLGLLLATLGLRADSEPEGVHFSAFLRAGTWTLLVLVAASMTRGLELDTVLQAQSSALPGWRAVFPAWLGLRNPLALVAAWALTRRTPKRGGLRIAVTLAVVLLLLGGGSLGDESSLAATWPHAWLWLLGMVVTLVKVALWLRITSMPARPSSVEASGAPPASTGDWRRDRRGLLWAAAAATLAILVPSL